MPYKTDEQIFEEFYETAVGKICYSTLTHPENNMLNQFISDIRKTDRESLVDFIEKIKKFYDYDDYNKIIKHLESL